MLRSRSQLTPAGLVVRWARLFKLVPRASEDTAMRVADYLREVWPELEAELIDLVETAVGDRASVAQRDGRPETVRVGSDGDTPTIDFPRVVATRARIPVDIRPCIAICTDEYSSKVWARIGMPHDRPFSKVETATVVDFYRRLAAQCVAWLIPHFRRACRQVPAIKSVRAGGELEVCTLAYEDREVGELLEPLRYGELTHDMLVSPGSVQTELATAFTPLLGEGEPAVRAFSDRDAVWITSPVALEGEEGWLQSRDALYLVREVEGRAQAVGVAFDDSEARELAWQSALTVSRWVASRV